MPASDIREAEGFPASAEEAIAELKHWKMSRFYNDAVPRRAAFVTFGLGLTVRRQIIVIEETRDGKLLNPARVYAALDDTGRLRRSLATECPLTGHTTPATIQSWFPIDFQVAIQACTHNPEGYSLSW